MQLTEILFYSYGLFYIVQTPVCKLYNTFYLLYVFIYFLLANCKLANHKDVLNKTVFIALGIFSLLR